MAPRQAVITVITILTYIVHPSTLRQNRLIGTLIGRTTQITRTSGDVLCQRRIGTPIDDNCRIGRTGQRTIFGIASIISIKAQGCSALIGRIGKYLSTFLSHRSQIFNRVSGRIAHSKGSFALSYRSRSRSDIVHHSYMVHSQRTGIDYRSRFCHIGIVVDDTVDQAQGSVTCVNRRSVLSCIILKNTIFQGYY